MTLFEVYECAISPEILERKIQEAEEAITGKHFVAVSKAIFEEYAEELHRMGFEPDDTGLMYRTLDSAEVQSVLHKKSIQADLQHESGGVAPDPDKREQLEAVKRWYENDWKRIDKKLQTSIIEGISVFLSLFDDSPSVKRTFCPPAELYKGESTFSGRRPLPPMATLLEQGKVIALNFPVGMNPGLARAIGVMLKMDFQRAVLIGFLLLSPTRIKSGARSCSSVTNTNTSRQLVKTNRVGMRSSLAFETSKVHPNRCHTEYQLPKIRVARRSMEDFAANLSNEDLLGAFR